MLIVADASQLPIRGGCVQTVVTSPPYWGLRDYGSGTAQIGLEPTPEAYVCALVDVFREVRRVLVDDGTVWCNLGDSYSLGVGMARGIPYQRHTPQKSGLWKGTRSEKRDIGNEGQIRDSPGLKPKDLVGIPWRVAFALQADGWYLRSDIIWSKPNPMPESVTDRPTKAHEYIFLLSKRASYYYAADAIRDAYVSEQRADLVARPAKATGPNDRGGHSQWETGLKDRRAFVGRNKRSVWHVATQPFSGRAKTSRQVRVSWDESDGDTTRTTSPSCPVHGDQAVQAANVLCGGRAADSLIRSGHTDAGHVLEPLPDCVPIVPPLDDCFSVETSDSSALSHAPIATSRSTRTRKTGRAPVTTSPCSVSVETPAGIGDMSATRETVDSAARMTESSTVAGSASCEPVTNPDGIPIRIGDKCSCAYYRTVTENTSHFATFPEALIEPCILAGCPVGGLVMDPFVGSGTVGGVSERLGRRWVGCDLSYQGLAKIRTAQRGLRFGEATA